MVLSNIELYWRDVYPSGNAPARLAKSNKTQNITSFHHWLTETYLQAADACGRTIVSQAVLRKAGHSGAGKGAARLYSLFCHQGKASVVRNQLVPEEGLEILFPLKPNDKVCCWQRMRFC